MPPETAPLPAFRTFHHLAISWDEGSIQLWICPLWINDAVRDKFPAFRTLTNEGPAVHGVWRLYRAMISGSVLCPRPCYGVVGCGIMKLARSLNRHDRMTSSSPRECPARYSQMTSEGSFSRRACSSAETLDSVEEVIPSTEWFAIVVA